MLGSWWRAAVRASRRPLGGLLSMRTIVYAKNSSPHPEGMATPRLSSRAQLNSHIVCRDLTNGATPSIVTLGLDPRAHGRAWRLASAIDPGSHSLRSLEIGRAHV